MTKDTLFPQALQDWYEANKSNIPAALTTIGQAYRPDESNHAFQVLFTMQRLAETGKGLRFRTKDNQIGSVWSHNNQQVHGILDTTREDGWKASTTFDFPSVAEFWLEIEMESDRNA